MLRDRVEAVIGNPTMVGNLYQDSHKLVASRNIPEGLQDICIFSCQRLFIDNLEEVSRTVQIRDAWLLNALCMVARYVGDTPVIATSCCDIL